MKVSILDPTGNITALVEGPVPPARQPAAAAKLMEQHPAVEQVGFVRFSEETGADAELRMAGGEFCGNASMCAAALALLRQGSERGTVSLRVSGACDPVWVRLEKSGENAFRAGVRMPKAQKIEERSFSFEGRDFSSPKDLAAYLQGYADRSPKALAKAVRPLFTDENNLDPRFEAWALMHGFGHELTLWKVRYQEGRGNKDDGPEDFVFDEDREPLMEAREQTPEEFALAVEGFDDRFVELLTRFAERIGDPKIFEGLMSDYFPDNRLQCYLLLKLYRMEIMRAIRETEEIDSILTARFEKRLTDDFGVGASFAGWAVGAWCRCYGERVLNKKFAKRPD